MKKILSLAIAVFFLTTAPSWASVTIDFGALNLDHYTPIDTLYNSGVTFETINGNTFSYIPVTNDDHPEVQGIGSTHPLFGAFQATLDVTASFVSVDIGDTNLDDDELFLEVFDINNNSLGYAHKHIDSGFIGLETLSVSADGIAYAIFGGGRDANGQMTGDLSTVMANNFTFEQTIPAPGAIVLGAFGVGIVGWVRRRGLI